MKVVSTIDQFNAYFHQATAHQMVAVGELSRAELSLYDSIRFDMYCVVLMDVDFGELVKAWTAIRYNAGTIFWIRPGQVISMNLNYTVKPQGWMLAFKKELLERTGLGRDFYMFDFFNHDVNDALALSPSERGIIINGFVNIQAELLTNRDYLSDHMLRLGIGVLLSYCKRFFERQFEKQKEHTKNIKGQLDTLIDNYLSSGSSAQLGQPTVAWCADHFNLSPNYFGNLVKHELHITAQEYIQQKIITAACHLLADTTMTVGEIAEELGFAYSTHFARMFRNKTGQSPQEFRKHH
ncbi:MAG: helix-turn-helix domain-containing protein [Phocaeicola sp.]|uniref:helix-turn-helix domain-containing protein n=2 Tax=Bacteroidaceae TaxID=815 RepID=UPI00234EAAEC|nr:helix-turn-helix domain-containing protein [Phocaeicola oris]MCE2616525.1 helix-turn-helix domain-containing protein [Phocaeicola oris]